MIISVLYENGFKYNKILKNKIIQEDYFDKLASKLPLF